MRLGEECLYITPCGWCSRKNIECEIHKSRIRRICTEMVGNASGQEHKSVNYGSQELVK